MLFTETLIFSIMNGRVVKYATQHGALKSTVEGCLSELVTAPLFIGHSVLTAPAGLSPGLLVLIRIYSAVRVGGLGGL
jgi:hypothetical protein